MAAGGTDALDDGVGLFGASAEIDRDGRAALRQRERDRPADAARSACDKRVPSRKINPKAMPPPSCVRLGFA
ncbi:hypothetical protein [Roseiarcus sp.]|uniref:hypothetical protein n=1 Tax=Roseiarcus sp. TaxID=1969460 RepID=UPI003F975E58